MYVSNIIWAMAPSRWLSVNDVCKWARLPSRFMRAQSLDRTTALTWEQSSPKKRWSWVLHLTALLNYNKSSHAISLGIIILFFAQPVLYNHINFLFLEFKCVSSTWLSYLQRAHCQHTNLQTAEHSTYFSLWINNRIQSTRKTDQEYLLPGIALTNDLIQLIFSHYLNPNQHRCKQLLCWTRQSSVSSLVLMASKLNLKYVDFVRHKICNTCTLQAFCDCAHTTSCGHSSTSNSMEERFTHQHIKMMVSRPCALFWLCAGDAHSIARG